MNRSPWLLLLFLSLARAEDVPFVRTELLAISIHEAVEGHFVRNGEQMSPFRASVTGLGPPIPYHGPPRLSLMPPKPDAEAPWLPVAQVVLPEGSDRVLLVYLTPEDQAPRLLAYDLSASNVPAGDYLFFNFAKQDVRIMLGEDVFPMRPGQIHQVGHPEWRKDNTDLTIRLAIHAGDKPRLVFSSVWGHHPTRKNMVFLFDGQHASMPVVLRKIHDTPRRP